MVLSEDAVAERIATWKRCRVLVVGLWFAGGDARAALPPLAAAFAVAD